MIKFSDFYSIKPLNYPEYNLEKERIFSDIENKTAEGSDMLGWLRLDSDLTKIKEIAKQTQSLAKNLIVIGIGGSFLGTKAVSDLLQNKIVGNEYNLFFVGNNINSDYIHELREFIKENDCCLNLVSKSGSTLEPNLAFRIIFEEMKKKYSLKELEKRIIITTDEHHSILLNYVEKYRFPQLIIPSDVGGRYSVFTASSLFALAFINADIDAFIKGAHKAFNDNYLVDDCDAFKYALNRYLLYKSGKSVECFVAYDQDFRQLLEWLKQLFGESEGKNGQGLLPIEMVFTSDLHSLGQFIQDGPKILFETIIKSKKEKNNVKLNAEEDNFDDLNRIAGKSLEDINDFAYQGVIQAHRQADIPIVTFELENKSIENIGYFMGFMMLACTYSAYLLGVNPFNQPGVEIYKKELKKRF